MVQARKNVRPISAGLVGTAVGAALGATAVALSEEKNRKRATQLIKKLSVQTKRKVIAMQKKASVVVGKEKRNGSRKVKIAQKRGVKVKK